MKIATVEGCFVQGWTEAGARQALLQKHEFSLKLSLLVTSGQGDRNRDPSPITVLPNGPRRR